MSVLLLKLAAPLQSWGVSSRFARRETQQYPSKSGIIGLISSAKGRRRTDPIEDTLRDLRFGVRIDQPGRLIRDFQVALSLDGRTQYPLSQRYYLADAKFVAGIEGETSLLEGIRDTLVRPEFPLYLGRRSCPVTESLVLDQIRDEPLPQALKDPTTWQAATWYRKKQPTVVHLPIFRDHAEDDTVDALTEQVRDVPLDFNPARREYGWRTVITDHIEVHNPEGRDLAHDPFAAFGGD
ncbi:type I-E CRISPR-associated protein Cas5/CasD [Nocardia uniformis]|uniref:Type I-E CRISPR-associated protein Cas5/CasD n=1 Tax=Nocardia uniformis TaxID=53432 RepID=A0A849CBL8_9NOCA|nr:type I-E CRISPR-associated protein Cas5/CasD [Nocardia uniformis]NNH72319.1 type I-E CRISPR-associated protein Cas5/CasD [Nocardia uniformis]